MLCPACSAEMAPTDRSCPKCGHSMRGEWRGRFTANFLNTRDLPGEVPAVYGFLVLLGLLSAVTSATGAAISVYPGSTLPDALKNAIVLGAFFGPIAGAILAILGLRRRTAWGWWLAVVLFGAHLGVGLLMTVTLLFRVAIFAGWSDILGPVMVGLFSSLWALPFYLLLSCRKRYFERKDSPG